MKWPGGAAQAREAGPTWKLQKRNFTSTRVNLFSMFFAFSLHCFLHFFRIFLHFFRIFLHFFAFFCIFFLHFFFILFAFPRLGVIFFAFFFAFPKPGVIFCIFLHFLDRVCHLHRLPDPYEKTTRK